jgi:hypothetical protein
MTIDLEKSIAATLHTRADRPVDTDALLAAATGRARVIGTRRKLLVVGAVAAVVAVTGTAVATAPDLFAGRAARPAAPSQSPSTEAPVPGLTPPPPGGYQVPSLPLATGVAGAAARPDLVGTDPAVLHFDLDSAAAGAYAVEWTSGEGHEAVDIQRPKGRLHLDLGPDLAKLDGLSRDGGFSDIWDTGIRSGGGNPVAQPRQSASVGGLPGTLDETRYFDGTSVWVLRWQPVKGLWARVEGSGKRDDVMAFAEQVPAGLARSRRCVVPVEIGKLPAGLRWTGCGVLFSGANPAVPDATILTFSSVNGPAVSVATGRGMVSPDNRATNRTVAGHRAWWLSGTLTVDYGDGKSIMIDSRPRAVTAFEQTAVHLAEALQPRGEPHQPAGWPTRAVPGQ